MLAYSLDLKGSEYFTIYVRRISDNKIISEEIKETSGSITWSLDDKYIFYSKLDKYHRPKKIYRHKIGSSPKDDQLIFEEKDEGFTCKHGILARMKNIILISTSDHTEFGLVHFFNVKEINIRPKIISKTTKKK